MTILKLINKRTDFKIMQVLNPLYELHIKVTPLVELARKLFVLNTSGSRY